MRSVASWFLRLTILISAIIGLVGFANYSGLRSPHASLNGQTVKDFQLTIYQTKSEQGSKADSSACPLTNQRTAQSYLVSNHPQQRTGVYPIRLNLTQSTADSTYFTGTVSLPLFKNKKTNLQLTGVSFNKKVDLGAGLFKMIHCHGSFSIKRIK